MIAHQLQRSGCKKSSLRDMSHMWTAFRWPTCSCLVPQLSSDREINILLKSSTTLCDIYCAVVRG